MMTEYLIKKIEVRTYYLQLHSLSLQLDGADLASPEVADGISSEEDGDGDGQQARQEEAVVTKALPRPEKQ